jgi:hypothetical protein
MSLQPPAVPDPAGGIGFISCDLEQEASPISIEQVVIESRRITIAVNASSEHCIYVFTRLIELLREIDQRPLKPEFKPLIMTEETTTVVQLDFPITILFKASQVSAFSDKLGSIVNNYGAKAAIWPNGVKFRISYLNPPSILKANNIDLVDREIRIEQRVNTAVEENTYFIISPNSSDIHMKLIAKLEEIFSSK